MTRSRGRRVMAQDSTPVGLRDGEDKDKSAVKTAFFNAQDGLKGRDGGPYLDHQERQEAEVVRAYREGREPASDLNGPLPASVGTFLVTAPQVDDNVYSNPSMLLAPGINTLLTDEQIAGNKDFADPISVLPVDKTTDDGADGRVAEAQTPNQVDVEGNGPAKPEAPKPVQKPADK